MPDLYLTIVLDGCEEPVRYRIPTLDPGGIRRAVDRWMERGIFVQSSSGAYRWYAPRSIRWVETPAGSFAKGAFEPFSVEYEKPIAEPQKKDAAVFAAPVAASIECPHCHTAMIPEKIARGPTAGMPKCTSCGKTIRPEQGETA